MNVKTPAQLRKIATEGFNLAAVIRAEKLRRTDPAEYDRLVSIARPWLPEDPTVDITPDQK